MVQLSVDGYWRIPPITRYAVTWTVVVSLGAWLGFINLSYFVFYAPEVFSFPPQIWRLVTGFFLTGGGMSLIFDTYFLYMWLVALETGHPRLPRRADIIWYLMFVGATILALDYFVALARDFRYIRPLTIAMCYTVTQQQQGMKGHLIIFEVPAPLMPYGMVAMNLLYGDVNGIIFDCYGLLAGHLFEFLTKIWPRAGGGFNPIPTPPIIESIVQWFDGNGRMNNRSWGTMFSPRADSDSSATTSGANVGPLPDSWRTRGAGRRLGS